MNTKITVLLVLVGALVVSAWIIFKPAGENVPDTFQYAEGVPCHSMGAFYMGECQFDANGNPTNL